MTEETEEIPKRIDLHHLATQRIPHITPARCASYAEGASYCLHEAGHSGEVTVKLTGDYVENLVIKPLPLTQEMKNSYLDLDRAAEEGAYAVAFLLIALKTPYIVLMQSAKGTGIDFYLVPKGELLFQKAARLEVSGIANSKGSNTAYKSRIRIKLKQSEASDHEATPAYVMVVEFGKPQAHLKSRNQAA